MTTASSPADARVRKAMNDMLESCAQAGTRPSVLALARQLGLTNTTFRRQHPDLVSQITQARRPEPDATSPTVGSAQQRLHARNAKLRRANRHLTDQLKLAAAQIQHLALENACLRATLEDQAKVARLVPRPTSGGVR